MSGSAQDKKSSSQASPDSREPIKKPAELPTSDSYQGSIQKTASTPPPYSADTSTPVYPVEKSFEAKAAPTSRTSLLPKVPVNRAKERSNRYLWILIACLLGSIYVVISNSLIDGKPRSVSSKCSGHGVELHGYTGSGCENDYEIANVHRKAKSSSTPSVLFVADSFGSLNPSNELSSAYESVAKHLSSKSFDVTVLYVGEPNHRFGAIAKKLGSKNLKLVQLPPSGLNYGPSTLTSLSADIFQWIRGQSPYHVVHFSSAGGFGYYTLNAKHQGLFAWPTKFIVSVDTTSIHAIKEMESEEKGFFSTEVEELRLEYMQEKSVEYADAVIAPTRSVVADIQELGWNLPNDAVNVVPFIPSSKSSAFKGKSGKTLAKEFVFIGTQDTINGLPLFCDAVDYLVEQNLVTKSKPILLTFLGRAGFVKSIPSFEYLESRSINWNDAVDWNVSPDSFNMDDLYAYLSEEGAGRVTVVPSLYEGSGYLAQEIITKSFPIIASRLPAIEELISVNGGSKSLFEANNVQDLAARLSEAMADGVSPVDITTNFLSDSSSQWEKVFKSLADAEIDVTLIPDEDDEPLVSVVLVHRNRHALLKQAIESLYQQTYSNMEVILVDDGSDDEESIAFLQKLAWEWWEEKGWKVIREQHRYLGASRNTGVKHAKGEYVLFMDDDDYAKPNQIETLVRVARFSHADVITAGHDLFEDTEKPPGRSGLIERRLPVGSAKYLGMLENCFGDSSMMVSRAFFVDFGGFTEDFGVGFEDYEFLAKVVLKGHHLEAVPEALHWYRRHRAAMSYNTDLKINQVRFLRSYIAESKSASPRQSAMLDYTRHKHFARGFIADGSPYNYNIFNETLHTPEPIPGSCGPSVVIDDFVGFTTDNDFSRPKLGSNALALYSNNQLAFTPNSDAAYFTENLAETCFDAAIYNTLLIRVGSKTPTTSSFRINVGVVDGPCALNNTKLLTAFVDSKPYGNLTSSQSTDLKIPLKDFVVAGATKHIDLCKIHSIFLDHFSDKKAFYFELIKFTSECSSKGSPVYNPPPTATGEITKETGLGTFQGCKSGVYDVCGVCDGLNGCVGITGITPPAADGSVASDFTLRGFGFKTTGAKLKCVIDGKNDIAVAPTVINDKSVTCRVPILSAFGGHTLTLSVKGAPLPYSRAFTTFPGDAHVTTCDAKARAGVENTIRLDGVHLVPTDSALCLIKDINNVYVGDVMKVNATVIRNNNYANGLNSTTPVVSYLCHWTPPIGGEYTIELSLDGGLTALPGVVKTKVVDVAPKFVSAQFDNSGASISVNFDIPIIVAGADRFSPWADCTLIFNNTLNENKKLGAVGDVGCTIADRTLNIILPRTATILANDSLVIRRDAIYSKLNILRNENPLKHLTFTVDAPLIPPKPVVSFRAPEIIGLKDYASISVASSYNGGGRSLKFFWTLSTNDTTALTKLNAPLTVNGSSIQNTAIDYIQYGSDALPAPLTFTVTVVATNYLGVKSDPTTITIFKSSDSLPKVLIAGYSSQTVDISKDYVLTSQVAPPQDFPNSVDKFSFLWEFNPALSTTIGTSTTLTGSTLVLKAGSLSPGVYTVKLTAWQQIRPAAKAYQSVTLVANAPPAQFSLSVKDFTAGISKNITLPAYYFDPLAKLYPVTPSVAWKCENVVNGVVGADCGFVLTGANWRASPSSLTIPANSLAESASYKFTATLGGSLGRSPIASSVVITTVAGIVPVPFAAVDFPTYKARRVLSTSVLSIRAGLQDGTFDPSKPVTYAWTTLAGTTMDGSTTRVLATIDISAIAKNSPILTLPSNFLAPGSYYRFQVTIGNNGKSVSTTTEVKVEKPVLSGDIGIYSADSPAYALSSDFEITANDWSVDPSSDMPLSYRFDFFFKSTYTAPAMSVQFQKDPKTIVRLPNPRENGKIYLRVTAKSTFGALGTKDVAIDVAPFTGGTTEIKDLVQNIRATALASGDFTAYSQATDNAVRQLLRNLGFFKRLRARSNPADQQALNDLISQYFTDVIDPSSNDNTADQLENVVCMLQTFVVNPDYLASSLMDKVLNTANTRINNLLDALEADPTATLSGNTKTCYNNVLDALTGNYALRDQSAASIAKIAETARAVNALYMREIACDEDIASFSGSALTENLQKLDLDGADFGSVASFPSGFSVTNPTTGSPVSCYCVQHLKQDAGLYGFVSDYSGISSASSGVSIGSAANSIILRDCSSQENDAPLNEPNALSVPAQSSKIVYKLGLTTSAKSAFNPSTQKVVCAALDTSTNKFSAAGVDTTYDPATNLAHCSSSKVGSMVLAVTPADGSSNPTNPTPTPTPGNGGGSGGSSTGSGLGGGAIAGIVIGCGAAAAAAGGAFYVYKKKQ